VRLGRAFQVTAGRRTREELPRTHRLGRLRFSDQEVAALRLAAERQGLSVGAFVAEAAVAVARDELALIPTSHREEMAEFVAARTALNRLGNNLNQAVRALNAGEQAPELAAVLRAVTRTVLRVEAAADALHKGRW
jgi:type II secretory pathway component PulF